VVSGEWSEPGRVGPDVWPVSLGRSLVIGDKREWKPTGRMKNGQRKMKNAK
jgi:hypothetical protein